MTITVAPDLIDHIHAMPSHFFIEVRGVPDYDVAAKALSQAIKKIAALKPASLSAPVPSGDGPFIWIEAVEDPVDYDGRFDVVGDMVAGELETAGVEDATVASAVAASVWQWALIRMPRPVSLVLYPPPPPVTRFQRGRSYVPEAWLEDAAAWLTEGLGPKDEVFGEIFAHQFPIAVERLPQWLARCRSLNLLPCTAIAGDVAGTIRGVTGRFERPDGNLELAFGGPGATDDELVAALEDLKVVARRRAPELSYAHIGFEPSFGSFLNADHVAEWIGFGGARWESGWGSLLCDETVMDAYPYQVLGPGHLARFGGMPITARPLDGGRVEVALGDPYAWLLDADAAASLSPWHGLGAKRRDPTIQGWARTVLAPCLVTEAESHRMLYERMARNEATGGKPR